MVLEGVSIPAAAANELAVVIKVVPTVLVTDNLVVDFLEKAGKARLNAIEVTKVD